MGLIDTRQRHEAEAMQAQVVELVRNRQWTKARKRSDELLAYITQASASATLEDIRRDKAYDAEDRVSAYLNRPGVRACVWLCGWRAAGIGAWSLCPQLIDSGLARLQVWCLIVLCRPVLPPRCVSGRRQGQHQRAGRRGVCGVQQGGGCNHGP